MAIWQRTKAAIVFIALTMAFATGCGHLGAAYAPAAAPADRGVVYVYRPSQHRGSALNLQVLIADDSQASSGGGTLVGMIENGGYVPVTALGKTRILFPYAKKTVDLNVEAGRSYYVTARSGAVDVGRSGQGNARRRRRGGSQGRDCRDIDPRRYLSRALTSAEGRRTSSPRTSTPDPGIALDTPCGTETCGPDSSIVYIKNANGRGSCCGAYTRTITTISYTNYTG